MGDSFAVYEQSNDVKATVAGVDWTRLDWYCSTPVVTTGLEAYDLVAVGLNVDEFDLSLSSFQNLTFTATIGLATTAEAGEYSLSSLVSAKNGPKFKYSLYLSVDEAWSDDDFEISLIESSRDSNEIQDKT